MDARETTQTPKKPCTWTGVETECTREKHGKGTIFHSDRGSQYTSAKVMEQLRKLGLKQSFSRVGMPGDNAWSESFFSILKKELVHPLGRFQIREQARQAVFAYINGFYNTKRIQKRLGYLSPLQWLTQWNSRNLVLTA